MKPKWVVACCRRGSEHVGGSWGLFWFFECREIGGVKRLVGG